MVLLLLILVVLAAGGFFAMHRRRTPKDLRGDWWSDFETDFWTYVQSAKGAQQRHPRRNRPPAA